MKYLGSKWEPADLAGHRVLVIPSGIGEMQWAMTKYMKIGEPLILLGLDGAPRRLHQFAELHSFVHAFGYTGSYDYSSIRGFQKHFGLDTWKAVREQFSLGVPVPLACNPHLEAGKPLAEWMPDLGDPWYSYPLTTTLDHTKEAARYFWDANPKDICLGISCASYRGAEAWHTWGRTEWVEFLSLIQKEEPHVRLVLLGGSWDDLTANIFDEDSGLRWVVDTRGIPPVGRTTFGGAVEILRRLDGYVGFSSGLGHVAAHSCGTPVFMLWPEHEQLLSRSWVNPELLENGSYVPSRWLEPKEVFKSLKPWLRRITDVRYERLTTY